MSFWFIGLSNITSKGVGFFPNISEITNVMGYIQQYNKQEVLGVISLTQYSVLLNILFLAIKTSQKQSHSRIVVCL